VGPSGIGKNTLIRELQKLYPDRFAFSISHTTREPREGERNAVHYHFVTKEKFEQLIANKKFLEYAEVHGNYYGTSFEAVRVVERTGKICVLDLNIDGAIAVSKSRLKPFIIFLRPDSLKALETRLRQRGTDTEESIQNMLRTAQEEMRRFEEHKSVWNLVVINDRLDAALVQISTELFKRYPLP
jgi:guanylate kinase